MGVGSTECPLELMISGWRPRRRDQDLSEAFRVGIKSYWAARRLLLQFNDYSRGFISGTGLAKGLGSGYAAD